eukprot:1319880-Amphidinium_carterae.1
MFEQKLGSESRFRWPCSGHKTHTTSTNVTSLSKDTMSGIANCLLAEQTSQLDRFTTCLSQQLGRCASSTFGVVHKKASLAANKKNFRHRVLKCFLPPTVSYTHLTLPTILLV